MNKLDNLKMLQVELWSEYKCSEASYVPTWITETPFTREDVKLLAEVVDDAIVRMRKTPTNFDRVTASPETLADITFDESHGWQAGCETRSCRLSCKECFLEWLKQPVSVKKDKEDKEVNWYYDVDHAPQGQELIVMYIDDHGDCPSSEVTVAMQDKGVWFNMLTGDFISEQICAYTYLPRPIPVNVLEKNVKRYKELTEIRENNE